MLNDVGNMLDKEYEETLAVMPMRPQQILASDKEFEETLAVMPNATATDTSITPMSLSAKHPSIYKCVGAVVIYMLIDDGEENKNITSLLQGNRFVTS